MPCPAKLVRTFWSTAVTSSGTMEAIGWDVLLICCISLGTCASTLGFAIESVVTLHFRTIHHAGLAMVQIAA